MLAWYQRLGRSAETQEPVMVINVDADRTDLVLIRQGRVLFSRSLMQGLQEWQAGAEGMGPIATELERSVSGLQKELPGSEARSLVLTGLGQLDQWKSFLEQRLGKPVMVKPAHGLLRLPPASSAEQASLAVVLGLALAEEAWLVNLLPREARHAQSHRRQMQELTFTSVLVLAAVLLGAWVLTMHVSRQERVINQTIKTLKALEAATGKAEHQERDVQLVEELLAARRWTATMLADLVRLTPPEVVFESLVFERARGELTVRGSAPSTRHVLDYIHQLEQSARWDRVELRYSARHGASADARTDFELVLRHGTAETRSSSRKASS